MAVDLPMQALALQRPDDLTPAKARHPAV